MVNHNINVKAVTNMKLLVTRIHFKTIQFNTIQSCNKIK